RFEGGIVRNPAMVTRRYDPDALRTLVEEISQAGGVPSGDAPVLADALVDADLHGRLTHGVSRLAIYLRRIEAGQIDPHARLRIDERRAGVLVVDAANGLGQVQAMRTLDRLAPRTRAHGLAAATIRRSQHFGALSYYCNWAARRDLILLATTSCEPSMSPEGGCEAFFGTNPIAASFPTGKDWPVTIDLATSIVARGNIIAASREGRPLPAGWALDPEGNATTDADAALAGTVLAMAGHKGYALALLVELLSSVLSGSAIGSDIGSMYKDLDRPQDVGHFFCLLDIAAFMEPTVFRQRIDRTIDRIKGCRLRPGVEEILVPGERSARNAEANRRLGVPLGAATVRELDDLSERFGLGRRIIPLA
ncbi:MAG: Ldh family oxidoreductase, partial [Vicinamibacteraceae bacterium]